MQASIIKKKKTTTPKQNNKRKDMTVLDKSIEEGHFVLAYFKTAYWKINSGSIKRYLMIHNDSLHWILLSLSLVPPCSVTPLQKSLFPRLTFFSYSQRWLWTVAAYLLCYHGIFMQKITYLGGFHLKWMNMACLVFLAQFPLENTEGWGSLKKKHMLLICNYEYTLSLANNDKLSQLENANCI